MSDVPAHPTSGSGRYEIRVTGRLDTRWAAWFDGFSLTSASDGTTVLAGHTHQAGLHGVLRTLADIGLTLVSVTRVATGEPATTGTTDPN